MKNFTPKQAKRAIQLLKVSAKFARENSDYGSTIRYDGTTCDGSCLGDDIYILLGDLGIKDPEGKICGFHQKD